ncbi:hypothetical protein [Citromicrobium bathyomarinum]|uniref:hypothetical protein n=1 Tax=Citromicrobium bathyomarinum TaxID=72174 RepID=UPI003159DA98
MTTNTPNCLDQWAEDARLFRANASSQVDGAQTIIVADFEYAWDRDRHDAYRVAEGASAEPTIRWPFHRIAAASWIVLRFVAGEAVPEIGKPIVLTAETMSEAAMVAAFFDALRAQLDAQLVTWGGETKDLAVLRQVAMMQDLVLPAQLADLHPHSDRRLDLCFATSVAAKTVHLPEIATAMGIPAKPSPSKSIGPLVEAGAWREVEEQVLADVITTSVIAIMQLGAAGRIRIDRPASLLALAQAVGEAFANSQFCKRSFALWARARHAEAGLRGTVFRAPEMA